jgi:two-component system, NtrC family, sensor kinase
MDNPFKDISQSLAKKLIITVGILMMLGGGISWQMLISSGKKNLMNNAVGYTASYSDLVKRSVRYNMLVANRDSIQHIVESIGATEKIKGLRIFDSRGKIFYSSDKTEIGHSAGKSSFACAGCHLVPGKAPAQHAGEIRWTTVRSPAGYRILTFVDPIYNEDSCATASCHVHAREQKVLGILETDFSLASVDSDIRAQAFDTTIYAVLFLGASALILYMVLRRFVLAPVYTIAGSMKKVAKGSLNETVPVTSRDEIGMLAGTFNMMTKDLRAAREKVDNWTQTLEEEIARKKGELKKSQDKLIQAEKLAALGRLTSDVAHEIRNPLTSIGGFAHRMEQFALSEKEKEYAGIVATEVKRLEKVLRDVLAFSGEERFHFTRNSADEVIRDVSALYRKLCEDLNVRLEVTAGEDLPLVLMDRNRAKQALGNLFANALDAMPDGGVLSIGACTEELNGAYFVAIKISDTGAGMPEEKLSRIFEPFFSAKVIRGTGLGLPIAKKIMEEHGGFVKAESVEGRGSRFGLYFPYQSEEESLKINCWEFMKCGREKETAMKCPAFPHFGRICWAVAGTLCEGRVQGTFALKYEDCMKCEYYRKVRDKEA